MWSRLRSRAFFLFVIACYISVSNKTCLAANDDDFILDSFQSRIRSHPNVTFYIYNDTTYRPDFVTNVDSLLPGKPLTVVFHGFTESFAETSMTSIKEALLLNGVQNVVIMDWKTLANTREWFFNEYFTVKDTGLPFAAKAATRWLKIVLKLKNIKPSQVHLIGFSLGAHLAGIVGNNFNSAIARISALDPPYFGFKDAPRGMRLDITDAQFVNVIHTSTTNFQFNCSGSEYTLTTLGYNQPIGHVDFFPNQNGLYQPHCKYVNFVKALSCSHSFAFTLFVESIFNPEALMARKCESWDQYENGACGLTDIVPMGFATPESTRGSFYMRTNTGPPFGAEDADNPLPFHVAELLEYDGSLSVFKPCSGSPRSYSINFAIFFGTILNLAKLFSGSI